MKAESPPAAVTIANKSRFRKEPVTAIAVSKQNIEEDTLQRKPQKVTTTDAKRTENEWWAKINYNSRQDRCRAALKHISLKYDAMRDDHLGRVSFWER